MPTRQDKPSKSPRSRTGAGRREPGRTTTGAATATIDPPIIGKAKEIMKKIDLAALRRAMS